MTEEEIDEYFRQKLKETRQVEEYTMVAASLEELQALTRSLKNDVDSLRRDVQVLQFPPRERAYSPPETILTHPTAASLKQASPLIRSSVSSIPSASASTLPSSTAWLTDHMIGGRNYSPLKGVLNPSKSISPEPTQSTPTNQPTANRSRSHLGVRRQADKEREQLGGAKTPKDISLSVPLMSGAIMQRSLSHDSHPTRGVAEASGARKMPGGITPTFGVSESIKALQRTVSMHQKHGSAQSRSPSSNNTHSASHFPHV